MRSALKLFYAGVLSVVLTGCGDVGTTTAPTSGNGSVGVTTNVAVTAAPTAVQVVDAGQTVALTAAVSGDSTNKGVTWSVAAGSGTLASTTALSNTYTAPATAVSNVVITATSVFDPTKSASVTVTVNALPSFTSTGQLTQGYLGVPYTATLGSTGGTGTRTYALATGSTLPAGLSLNAATGVIAGTPTTRGTGTFSVTVTDSATAPVTANASFSIGVSSLQVVSPVLVDTVVGRAYPAKTYTAAFAQGAVTYAVTAGSLPAGLSLSSAGVLSGTATTAGPATVFTITATDSVGQTATTTGSIKVASVLTLAGGTIPTIQANSSLSPYPFTASGGTGTYAYRLTAGSALPTGLSLSLAGALFGTPSQPGTFQFGVTVVDNGDVVSNIQQSVTAQYTLVVTVQPLAFTPDTTLPNAVVGSPYSQPFVATGGIGPYSYSVTTGALPAGLRLTTAGMISGRVTGTGTTNFTVTVQDSEGTPLLVSHNLTLVSSNTLTPGSNNSALNGQYAFSFTGQSNAALGSTATTNGQVYGADMAGSLNFDGSSLVTGTIDLNSSQAGVQSAVAVTGSYSLGDDNRGKIVLRYSGKVLTLDIAASGFSSGIASKYTFIEADSDNAIDVTQVQGTGEAYRQTASDFTMASLLGRYVFKLGGETPTPAALTSLNLTQPGVSSQFGALSAAGYISLTGAGLIVRGTEDAQSYSAAYNQISLTGSYTAPDANGRGSMTITSVGNSYPAAPTHYVYYVVNAKQIVLLSLDAHSSSALMAGMAYQQQQALYTSTSLSGTVLGTESAVQGGNGTTTFPSTMSAVLYVLRVTSPGVMSAYTADNTAGVSESFQNSPDRVTYSVSDAGRVTLFDTQAPTAQLPVFWLYDQNKGVGTELSTTAGSIATLALEGQNVMTFDATAISGIYSTGTAGTVAPAAYVSGSLNATAIASATATQDISNNGLLTAGSTTVLTKGVEGGTGRFTLSGGNILFNGYILSPSKLIYFNAASGFTKPTIRFAEK